jgi:uncharacterized iron-regulated membrane protein
MRASVTAPLHGEPRSAAISGWQRWVLRPQTLHWRRWLLRVHLWVGLAAGVYILVLSVSGSAVVLRPQFHMWMTPRSVPTEGTRLTGVDLHDALRRSYAGYEVASFREPPRVESPVFVTLERAGETSERLFDPYAVRDLGLAYPDVLRAVEWLVDLHDNLLGGETGRAVNGVGGSAIVLLVLTGAVLWWPGKARWRQALVTGPPAKTRRFALRLHNALGLWSIGLVFVWAITAVYFAFPAPFEGLLDFFDADPSDLDRPGDPLLQAAIKLHFGRFGGMPGRLLWIALGLTPAALFVTGLIMWWTRSGRVRRRAWAASLRPRPQQADA